MKNFFSLFCILLISLVSFSGCFSGQSDTSSSGASNESTAVYQFTDALNHQVTLSKAPQRVVSLMGSFAEIWLLAGGELVGTTEDAKTERGLSLSDDTAIIGTVKSPNTEVILGLSPDFVLLSSDIESHVKFADTLQAAKIPYAFFKVEEFSDYLQFLKIATELTQRPDLYEKNGTAIEEKIKTLTDSLKEAEDPPSVLLIRALSTKVKAMPLDNMVSRMLTELKADNITSRQPSLLEELNMEAIIEEDPDYILAVPMGSSEKAAEALRKSMESNPAWQNLSAVKNGRYLILPKELFHYKPNARWGESYEYLAKILYPEQFQ